MMQITLGTSFSSAALGIAGFSDALAVYAVGTQVFLVYGAEGAAGVTSLALTAAGAPGSGVLSAESLGALQAMSLQPSGGLAVQQVGGLTRLYCFGGSNTVLTAQILGADGLPGGVQTVLAGGQALTGVSSLDILGGPSGTQAALSFWNQPGIAFYGIDAGGNLGWQSAVADSPKSYLSDVADTLSVSLGGATYVLCLSAGEGGITSMVVDAQGRAGLVDSLGAADGLPLAGAAAMQAVTQGGSTFVVVAATLSSALTVVRVNDMGCLFAADTLYDDRSTRFAGAEVLDSFAWSGRNFVVTAGTDAGISILELRPDGKLTPFLTGVFETGTGLAAVTGLEAAITGTRLDVYVVDAPGQAIRDFQVDLSQLGGLVQAGGGTTTGTAADEFLWGGSGAQTLIGGGGEDWIFDGSGADSLTGGAGADVFLLAKDGSADTIADFELHKDRIDLSDWGRIYQASDLTITSTATGAVIAWGNETLTVTNSAGTSLTAASFVSDDFIFI